MPRFQAIRCWRCSAPVLRGYDAELAAIMVTADPVLLDSPGTELVAIMAGRGTFLIRRGCLVRRDQWMIRHAPPDSASTMVVPEHRCGEPFPGVGLALRTPIERSNDRMIEAPPY